MDGFYRGRRQHAARVVDGSEDTQYAGARFDGDRVKHFRDDLSPS
jgi:hypothetical protein